MDLEIIAIIAIVGVIFLVLIGIPIAIALLFSAVAIIFFGLGEPASLMKLGTAPFGVFYGMTWTPLPLFILLAYVINETTIATDVFTAANNWLSRIRGGLVVSSIMGEAVMAAAIGSSTVTMLAVGKVSLPEMERLNYNKRFSLSALLAGGVLGPLIPPSIPLVVYGILTQQSISRLLIAGVIPGILLVIILSALAMVTSIRHPSWAPRPTAVIWRERLSSLRKIWPILVVMVGIISVIYLGVATATEAAGVGVVIALLIAVVAYRFRFSHLRRAMSETATVTGMVGLMVIAATVFTFAVGVSGLARDIADFIVNLGLSPWWVIIMINVVLLILGCLMDTLAIVLLTVPIFVPLIVALGFDPIWFGVVLVVNTEIGLITPPIGLNTFIASQIFRVPIIDLLRGVIPFLIVLLVFLGIIIALPQLSLWLPSLMSGG